MRVDRGNPTNLELLRLAKELAYADYNNRRANIHNEWLVDNERMQKTHRTNVPYPTIPPYPTEEEIIYRAEKLIEFLNRPRADLEKEKLQDEVKQLITDVEQEIGKKTDADEQLPPAQDESIKLLPARTEVDRSTTPPVSENTSVFGKIKNAWR